MYKYNHTSRATVLNPGKRPERKPSTVRPIAVKHQPVYACNPVTICIAAISSEHKQPRIVTCCDSRLSVEWSSTDAGQKMSVAGHNWIVLMAGNWDRAVSLVDYYREYFYNTEVTSKGLISQVKEPLRLYRRSLMEDETRKYGLSLDDFLGGKKTPKGVEAAITAAIQGIDIGCQLLLTGFIDSKPFIFQIDNETVKKIESFSAIGSGAYLAQAALNQRMYRTSISEEDAIYLVYEAKRASERADGISSATIMFIQEPTGGPRDWKGLKIAGKFVSVKGVNHLSTLYVKRGLQPLTATPQPEDFYSPLTPGQVGQQAPQSTTHVPQLLPASQE